MILKHGLAPADRPRILALLESLTAFTPDERAVAMELVDAALAHPASDDYRFILSVSGEGAAEQLAGYLCYGRTPMTQSTYDLYWIGTSPAFARLGVARNLVASLEAAVAQQGGGIIRVETGSREGHGAAVHFYDAVAFARAATIPDFYAPGDDLIIFTKRVAGAAAPAVAAMDDAALYDAALGYRDYTVERDFLLACAKRFGKREIRRVLGWASGPARHLWAFADLGISAVGAEASPSMIAYAQRIAHTRPGTTSPVRFVQANLDERPAIGAPVDLSFVPLSAIHLLGSPDAVERHLRLAAEQLAPGGLHIIEATHPADLTPAGVHHTEWTEVRGAEVIDARFRIHIDKTTADRVVPVTLEVVCSAGKKGPPAAPRAASRLRQEDRWYVPELDAWRSLIARVPQLSLAATLGDFNVDTPFEHSAAWRLILVIERR